MFLEIIDDTNPPFSDWWLQLLWKLVFVIVRFFLSPLNSQEYIYWVYLLSAACVALVVFLFSHRGFVTSAKAALSPRVWWSRSSRADYRYFACNGILFPLIFAPLLLSASYFGDSFSQFLAEVFGSPVQIKIGWWVYLAYTIVFFVLHDFGRFLAHYCLHKIPLLWCFHKVHHSAEVLTPITSFRSHPVELIIMAAGANSFVAIAYGLFQYMFPGQFGFWHFLGGHVIISAYKLVANLRHSHVWLSYGWLEKFLISPAMHQIHHSALIEHRDKNIGFGLSVWDGWFGTRYMTENYEEFPMGIGDGLDDQWHSVRQMYVRPFAEARQLFVKSVNR